MGFDFAAVKPRRSSPMPSGGPRPGQFRPHKRTRRRQSSKILAHDTVDEEAPTADDATVSTTASEASSNVVLDFLGNACLTSAWFTGCFPCAVVDINDGDDRVAKKLSRESAMSVMYSSRPPDPVGDAHLLHIQLPEAEGTAPSHGIPPVIAVNNSQEEDEVTDAISLDDDEDHPCWMPITPERPDSVIMGNQGSQSFDKRFCNALQKKMKLFRMKMFGRKGNHQS